MSSYLTWVHDAVDDYLTGLSLKAMLLGNNGSTDYAYNVAHAFRADVSGWEVAGTAYTAGGIAVTGVVITQDGANLQVTIDCADLAFGPISVDPFVAVAIYVDTGSDATDTLLSVDVFGATLTDGLDDFTYIVGDDGFIALEV